MPRQAEPPKGETAPVPSVSPPTPGPLSKEEDLADLFDRLVGERDPLRRRLALLAEADRLDLEAERLEALLADYAVSRRTRRGTLERWLYRLARRLEERSFFEILEYVGRLAIIVAILSFFLGLPERQNQAATQRWESVRAAAGNSFDSDRAASLEELNRRCLPMQGLEAPGAYLEGLALDRCHLLPGDVALAGGRLGPFLPFLYDYRGADLRGADLERANLRDARLPGVDLRDGRLTEADLSGADLSGADLSRADLSGADLSWANLSGADLTRANLSGAVFHQANLEDARLLQARVCSAQFLGAVLRRARLEYVVGCPAQVGPPEPGSAIGATPAWTEAANFSGSDLRDAQFYNASLAGSRFQRVRLSPRTAFDQADLTATRFDRTLLPEAGFFSGFFENARVPPGRSGGTEPGGAALAALPMRLGVLVPLDHRHFDLVVEGVRGVVDRTLGLEMLLERRGSEGWDARRLAKFGRDVDAILLHAPGIERATLADWRDSGVTLACYDQCPEGSWASTYLVTSVESDGESLGFASGRLVREWQARRTGPGSSVTPVLVLRSCEGMGCFERVQGLRRALTDSRLLGPPLVEAAYRVATGQEAFAAACGLLRQVPGPAVLWAANEPGTGAAVQAVRALGREGEVAVFGIDWTPTLAAMLLHEDGVLQGVVAQNPEAMGRIAADRALDAALHRSSAPYRRSILDHQPHARWLLRGAAGREVRSLASEQAGGQAGEAGDRAPAPRSCPPG